MMRIFVLIYLLSGIISVYTNPLAQLVQSCPACQPTVYSNPTSIPVVIQQPNNNNPYPQATTVQTATQGSFGDTLNQIILNRILTNPSLQKISDPNTKLYNQNGEEIQRHVATSSPNVVNNYFIVPPEFFNLTETEKKYESNDVVADKRRHRTKSKRPIIVETEDDDDDVVIVKKKSNRRRPHEPTKNSRTKTKRVKEVKEGEHDDSLEISPNRENNIRKHRKRISDRNREITPTSEEGSNEVIPEPEVRKPIIRKKKRKRSKRPKINKPKSISSEDNTKSTLPTDKKDSFSIEEPEIEIAKEVNKSKKKRQRESNKNAGEPYLKNIELPTDVASQDLAETRKVRGSKRNASKKEPVQKTPPIPDDNLQNFFPYMPMGNFYNTNTNYPYNFDHYYQYLDPVRNSNANRSKKDYIDQNRNNNGKTPTQKHTIEIKLKPKKKANSTENPVTTTTAKEDLTETTVPAEIEPTTESFELEIVSDIPMEIPHAVSPIGKVEGSSSIESYETFSELEALSNYSPKLGEEDEIPAMNSNALINDYYPVFFNPEVENLQSLEDNRYFYESRNEEELIKESRKNDRYEDFNTKTKKSVKDNVNKYDQNGDLDHTTRFSDTEYIKPRSEITRIKVPPKNTRIQSENVETVFAGSKVAKFGVVSEESLENTSTSPENSAEINERVTQVIGKSLGRPEDYW